MDCGVFNMSDDAVLRTYADTVYKVAYRYTQNAADAEDVFSDTFLAYYTKHPEFESEEHCKAWLLRVAINLSRNVHRAAKHTDEMPDDIPAEEKGYTDAETSADLAEALGKIRPEYREVIELFYLQELSIHEVAEVLGRNESTVRTQLQRAREQLRKFLS